MAADDYVRTYLQLRCWVVDRIVTVPVRQYLQNGMQPQSAKALTAYSKLIAALPKVACVKQLPTVFKVCDVSYVTTSLRRVYLGKGAPNEIQDAIWLASLCGLVDASSVAAYADDNLGVDCGGFVASYWGLGRPSADTPTPTGYMGYLPRTIWGLYKDQRRTATREIQAGDAAVFFQDVKSDNPDILAQKVNGSYDRTTGSQAFHIGVVSSTSVDGDQLTLQIAESSGAKAASGGNGVNVRSLDKQTPKVAKGLVYCKDGDNRVYFTGRQGTATPYPPNNTAD